jgi:hypothetical protein
MHCTLIAITLRTILALSYNAVTLRRKVIASYSYCSELIEIFIASFSDHFGLIGIIIAAYSYRSTAR